MSKVAFIGPRSRYNIVGVNNTWLRQLGTLDGKRPRTAELDADELDPVVSAGQALWANLTEGGLFSLLGDMKQALVLEAVVADGTFQIVAKDGTTVLRPGPTTFPAKIAPGEYLRFSSGTRAEVLVRIDGVRVL